MWSRSGTSHLFLPETGSIAAKVINHHGNEVLKTYPFVMGRREGGLRAV